MITLYDDISRGISELSGKDLENQYYDRCNNLSAVRILNILNKVSYWCLTETQIKRFEELVKLYTATCSKEEGDIVKTEYFKLVEYYNKNQECNQLEKYEMVNNNFKIKHRPIITVTKDS